MAPDQVNRSEAERFVVAVTGVPDAPATVPIDVAIIPDKKTSGPRPERMRGTLNALWDRLVAANATGGGVFMTINESNGETYLDDSITDVRAVFVDDDGSDPPITFEALSKIGPRPSMTVQSKNGQHNYWFVRLGEGEDTTDFTPMQKALAKKFGTDPKISNLGRVMRMPGFLHQKGEPFLVRLIQVDDSAECEYTIRALIEGFKIPITTPALKAAAKKKSKPREDEDERVKRARAYVTKMGPAVEGSGGDAHTFKVATVLVRDFDLDDEHVTEIMEEWNETCQPSWSSDDLLTKIRNARAYGKGEVGSKLDDSVTERLRGAFRKLAEGAGPAASDATVYRPARPEWSNKQFAADRGPLVHYIPGDNGEWMQTQPSSQQIADAADQLVRYCDVAVFSFHGLGNRYYAISPSNIATPTTRELLMPAVRDLCKAMMGSFAPTPETFVTAEQHIRALPRKGEDLPPLRWEGDRFLALHELPRPKEGDWSAHKEFTDRCSCPDTLMAWTWSCFIPEEQTGRESLLLHGAGQDGKSYFCEALLKFLGPVAAASEILKGENRFELSRLVGKRLAYFGDFRNPRPIHAKVMRELISGAYLATEEKNGALGSAYFHPRCLLTTNVEPRITSSDRAEYTRVRRINVRQLKDNQGDLDWKNRLLQQMPAFLYECRKVYERFVVAGKDLPYTQACKDALKGGEKAMAEDFDFLAEHLEITGNEEDRISSKRLCELMEQARYKEWVRKDAYAWLRATGATNQKADGSPLIAKVRGVAARMWCGVREIDSVNHAIYNALTNSTQPQAKGN